MAMERAEQFETRYLNRMSTMLQSAFEQACAEQDIESAEELLGVLEIVMYRAASREEHREKSMSVLQSAFSHMWAARQARQASAGHECPATPHIGSAQRPRDTRRDQ